MKKITALVLALVMTLSLLPMNVWAEGEEYKPLYWGNGDSSNLTYSDIFRGDLDQGIYEFRCFTEQNESALITSEGGYTLLTEGNIGTFSARTGDCVWNLASATDVEGYLRVEKDNTVYRMKVTINNGRDVFTYQGVDIYTAYDDAVLGYGDWNYSDLSLDINGGKGISTYVPYVTDAETTSASVYLKPAAGLRLVLPEWRQRYTTLSNMDSNDVYMLTNNDLSQNTSVQVYNEKQLIGEIDLIFVPRNGSSGNQGGGNPTAFNYKGVEIYTQNNQGVFGYQNWQSHDGLRIIPTGENNEGEAVAIYYTSGQDVRLFLKPTDDGATLIKGDGYLKDKATLTYEESTGMYELLLSDADASGGNVKVNLSAGEEIDFMYMPEEVRQLYVNVGNDTNRDYRTVFQAYRNDTEPYGLWFFIDDETGNKVEVNGGYKPSVSEGIGSLYFVENRGFLWDFSGAITESGFLEMRNDAVPGVVYRLPVTVNEGSGDGNQGGDGHIRYQYTTSRGNSILEVTILPEQAAVIDLPESGRLENDTLTVTLKTADPTLWLPLLYNDDGLLVHFEVFPAINGQRIDSTPQIAEYADTLPLEDQNGELGLISLLVRDLTEGHDAFFKGYNAPTARLNGLYYAWSSEESDGDITIIPNDDNLNFAWVWNYDGVEALPDIDEDWLPDGYCLRFVMSNEISGAITLKANPSVDAERIKLVSQMPIEPIMDSVESLFRFKENNLGTFTYEEDGVLTYLYDGEATSFDGSTNEVKAAASNTAGTWTYDDGLPGYSILEIYAPVNYVAKALAGSYVNMTYDINDGKNNVVLPYRWTGLGTEHIYAVTWHNPTTHQDYTEQLLIKTPSVDGAEKWLDRFGARIPAERVQYTDLPDDCGASISYEDGFILTTFDNNAIVDVNTVLGSQVFVTVPEVKIDGIEETVKPVELRILPLGYDGADDPTLNFRTQGLVEAFRMDIDNKSVIKVSDIPVAEDGKQKVSPYLDPLKKQTIGEIEYYYSADRMTHFALMRWDFPDGSGIEPLYEYMEIETTNYFCQWEEEVKADSAVTDAVEKPTAVLDALVDSNFKLKTRVHPQKQDKGYGQYFFELEMVDENESNVCTETDGTTYFTIILPYSFMGEEWNYEMAKELKEKPIINHYDKNYKQLAGNMGAITGEYTERGIEFKVNSFSPFMLTWTEETIEDNTGGFSGYYPIVMPEEDTTAEDKPAETKPAEKPAVTPPAEDVTPAPEDTAPVVPDEPVADDPVVDAPADDTAQNDNSGAGLWIGIGLVALAAIVVVLIVTAVRKKRKG